MYTSDPREKQDIEDKRIRFRGVGKESMTWNKCPDFLPFTKSPYLRQESSGSDTRFYPAPSEFSLTGPVLFRVSVQYTLVTFFTCPNLTFLLPRSLCPRLSQKVSSRQSKLLQRSRSSSSESCKSLRLTKNFMSFFVFH